MRRDLPAGNRDRGSGEGAFVGKGSGGGGHAHGIARRPSPQYSAAAILGRRVCEDNYCNVKSLCAHWACLPAGRFVSHLRFPGKWVRFVMRGAREAAVGIPAGREPAYLLHFAQFTKWVRFVMQCAREVAIRAPGRIRACLSSLSCAACQMGLLKMGSFCHFARLGSTSRAVPWEGHRAKQRAKMGSFCHAGCTPGSAESRMPSPQCRLPSAECRVPSACLSPSSCTDCQMGLPSDL